MNIRNLFRPDPLPLEVRPEPKLGGKVEGKVTMPSKPYDWKNESGARWKRETVADTIRKAREELAQR